MEAEDRDFTEFRDHFEFLRREIGKVFVGQTEVVEQILICLFCGGHILLEGMPGLGKTLLVKTVSKVLDLTFSRIQCTPDLMPSDITGTNMLVEDEHGKQTIEFRKGPIFANIVLVDEVNRATPKTQSAFLEAMQEKEVTALGTTYPLARPFFLLGTQNPIEIEGTFPLPEAQLDRFFFKLSIEPPDLTELSRIIDLTTGDIEPRLEVDQGAEMIGRMSFLVRQVKLAEHVKQYALRIVSATHPQSDEAPETVKAHVKYGASPRAAQSIILGAKARSLARGRYNVSVEDLVELAIPSLNHRVILNFEGVVAGLTTVEVLREVLAGVQP